MTARPPPPPPPLPIKRGPGRPPGRKNNATLIRLKQIEAAMNGITPESGINPENGKPVMALEYLQALYRDPTLPVEVRVRAASLAGPLETARPVPPPPEKTDEKLADSLDRAFKRTGRQPFTLPKDRVLSAEDQDELNRMLGLAP